jgi:hypothetical protein
VASLLKKLAQLLTADLTGQTWTEEVAHPYFGKMVLFASKSKPNSYWEATLRHDDDEIGLFVNAPDRSPPSDAAVSFARMVLADVDRPVARALPLLARRFQEMYKRPFPSDWRSTFRLSSFEVPTGGDSTNPWSISLEALDDSAGHVFTCYFENDEPVNVTVDG